MAGLTARDQLVSPSTDGPVARVPAEGGREREQPTFEVEQERKRLSEQSVPRRRISSKRPVESVDVRPVGVDGNTRSDANPSNPIWDERNPNWTGTAWLPRSDRAVTDEKKYSRSSMDNRRADRPRENNEHLSEQDPVADPCVEDLPPLNVRLAARKHSAQEVLEHNVTHLPYRAWCETCVASRGVDDPHRRPSL